MVKCVDVRGNLVALEPTNFGAPYQALFDQTDVSGYDLWRAYSHNNFDNQLAKADEALYKSRGLFGEILRDKIIDSTGLVNGRLMMKYVSHAGLANQKEHDISAPINGYWVPTKDGIFVQETLIPFETVTDRKEAIKRLKAAGIPKEQVSYFYRNDNYHDAERFVGRNFVPGWGDVGRFLVGADWFPSYVGIKIHISEDTICRMSSVNATRSRSTRRSAGSWASSPVTRPWNGWRTAGS